MSKDTKTIDQFLAEAPNVDVSAAWERSWKILTGVKEKVAARFPVTRHPSSEGREYYTSANGEWEGSMNSFTGEGVDWLVNSWLGSRKNSILDMNATVFLGQQTRVPHLIVVFGTIPKVFFYADYCPRVDIRTDEDYLKKYYEPANADFLKLRGDERFTWSVSHGTYMRSMLSPVCVSMMADMNDGIYDTLETYVDTFVNRWFTYLDEAEEIPVEERAAQQEFDFKVRELGYRLDPMNKLAVNIFGEDEVDKMVENRMGLAQMEEAKGRWK